MNQARLVGLNKEDSKTADVIIFFCSFTLGRAFNYQFIDVRILSEAKIAQKVTQEISLGCV